MIIKFKHLILLY